MSRCTVHSNCSCTYWRGVKRNKNVWNPTGTRRTGYAFVYTHQLKTVIITKHNRTPRRRLGRENETKESARFACRAKRRGNFSFLFLRIAAAFLLVRARRRSFVRTGIPETEFFFRERGRVRSGSSVARYAEPFNSEPTRFFFFFPLTVLCARTIARNPMIMNNDNDEYVAHCDGNEKWK